jgi:hypothetical protein
MIRELLFNVTEHDDGRAQVHIVYALDDEHGERLVSAGVVYLSRDLLGLARGYVDTFGPQIAPEVVIRWGGPVRVVSVAPPSTVARILKVARSLKLLPELIG